MGSDYRLAIVGAGLSALAALRAGAATGPTLVIDYQEAPGGLLRHALPAPEFARAAELVRGFALPTGVTLHLQATAVGLLPALAPGEPHTLLVRSAGGTSEVRAERVLIACGGLERPREHDQIPGTRPAGVMTPVMAHQLLARGYLPARRPLVYGGTRAALACARRLAAAGAEVTLAPPPGCRSGPDVPGTRSTPPATLVEVCGYPRVSAARLRLESDEEVTVRSDGLVYAVGLLPNTHWLRGSGVEVGPDGAIVVDEGYRASVPGIYAVGTVVAPSLDHERSIAMGEEVAATLREDGAR